MEKSLESGIGPAVGVAERMPGAAARLPLGKPFLTGRENEYVSRCIRMRQSGDGPFTVECHRFLERRFATKKALLTPSCTSALEMAALLFDIRAGDEVILPSYTFVSTANAFLLRGAKPVFVDIRADTLCMDERLVAKAVTSRTKAIVPVHYAGNACDMDEIMSVASRHGLLVAEDAAQGLNATYRGRHLGTIGHVGTYSFHETKNVSCGEGGALMINDDRFVARAEILREKGTDRSRFLRGEAQKYTWQDIGSSYLPSEMQAAFLLAQLEGLDVITEKRRRLFRFYQERFATLRDRGLVGLPGEFPESRSNHHLYYLLLNDEAQRGGLMSHLERRSIASAFHFLPLHLSPMGRAMGGGEGQLPVTEALASRLLRIPAYTGMEAGELDRVADGVEEFFIGRSR